MCVGAPYVQTRLPLDGVVVEVGVGCPYYVDGWLRADNASGVGGCR